MTSQHGSVVRVVDYVQLEMYEVLLISVFVALSRTETDRQTETEGEGGRERERETEIERQTDRQTDKTDRILLKKTKLV